MRRDSKQDIDVKNNILKAESRTSDTENPLNDMIAGAQSTTQNKQRYPAGEKEENNQPGDKNNALP